MTGELAQALAKPDNRVCVRIVWDGRTTELALDTVGEVTLDSVIEVARQCYGIATEIRGGSDG